MQGDVDSQCRRNCWLIGAVAAALVAVLLLAVARYPWTSALLIGIVLFSLGGSFLAWAFCSGRGTVAATSPDSARIQNGHQDSPVTEGPATRSVALPPVSSPVSSPVSPPVSPSVSTAQPPEAAPKRPSAIDPPQEPASAGQPTVGALDPVAVAVPLSVSAKAESPRPLQVQPLRQRKPSASATAPRTRAPRSAVSDQPVAVVKGASARAPKAAGLDAAMGRRKDMEVGGPVELFLAAPRNGRADDLKLIKGIGPVMERLLNSIGIWHFDQIAAWKAKDIALVDGHMQGFKGRITRDEWVRQARQLARAVNVER